MNKICSSIGFSNNSINMIDWLIFRGHGLAGNALFDVARSTMVAQLLYASPAWWGFLKADEQNRLQSVVRKAQRSGFLPNSQKTLDELRKELD